MSAHECKHEADVATLLSESKATRSDVAEIKKCLITGNGVPAMTVRVAKLEQIAAGLIWVTTAVVGSFLGILVVAFFKGVKL